MSLGYDRELNVVNKGDTAQIDAFLYDKADKPLTADDLVAVSFTIQAPDQTKTTVAGEVTDAGVGHLAFDGTTEVGQYVVVASFTLSDGSTKSTRTDFEVIDPFNPETPTQLDVIGEAVWHKLEDCFDAEDAGPWLRDMTLTYFNKDKMGDFVQESIFDINQINPPTELDINTFVLVDGTPTTDLPLLAQATLISVIHHLIRSYTEQPNPVGAQIAWHDRRDYLERWQAVLAPEAQRYERWVRLWKRQFLQLGQARVLVSSKAGRLIPAPMRTRNIGRGYYG